MLIGWSISDMKKMILIFVVLIFTGCTMDGKVINHDGKIRNCIDTRDKETFSFDPNKITNTRIGIGAPSCFDVVDEAGKKRMLCTDMASYIKCTL